MDELEFLYEKIKTADIDGNVILPKEYLKKFIMMNILMMKSEFKSLDKDKQEKYLNTLRTLTKLFM